MPHNGARPMPAAGNLQLPGGTASDFSYCHYKASDAALLAA